MGPSIKYVGNLEGEISKFILKNSRKGVRGGVKILGKSAKVLYECSLGQNIEAILRSYAILCICTLEQLTVK